MGAVDDIGQKILSKVEEIEGEAKKQSGRPISGTIQKTKGKIRETVADAKLKARARKTY